MYVYLGVPSRIVPGIRCRVRGETLVLAVPRIVPVPVVVVVPNVKVLSSAGLLEVHPLVAWIRVHNVRIQSRETPANAFIQHGFVHMPYEESAVGQIRVETESSPVLQEKIFISVGVGQDYLVDLRMDLDIAYVESIGIAVDDGGSDPSQFYL